MIYSRGCPRRRERGGCRSRVPPSMPALAGRNRSGATPSRGPPGLLTGPAPPGRGRADLPAVPPVGSGHQRLPLRAGGRCGRGAGAGGAQAQTVRNRSPAVRSVSPSPAAASASGRPAGPAGDTPGPRRPAPPAGDTLACMPVLFRSAALSAGCGRAAGPAIAAPAEPSGIAPAAARLGSPGGGGGSLPWRIRARSCRPAGRRHSAGARSPHAPAPARPPHQRPPRSTRTGQPGARGGGPPHRMRTSPAAGARGVPGPHPLAGRSADGSRRMAQGPPPEVTRRAAVPHARRAFAGRPTPARGHAMAVTTDVLVPALEDARAAHAAVIDRSGPIWPSPPPARQYTGVLEEASRALTAGWPTPVTGGFRGRDRDWPARSRSAPRAAARPERVRGPHPPSPSAGPGGHRPPGALAGAGLPVCAVVGEGFIQAGQPGARRRTQPACARPRQRRPQTRTGRGRRRPSRPSSSDTGEVAAAAREPRLT
jgi:hypothetical protein